MKSQIMVGMIRCFIAEQEIVMFLSGNYNWPDKMDVIYLLGSIGLGWGSSFVHPSAWAVNVNSSAPAGNVNV